MSDAFGLCGPGRFGRTQVIFTLAALEATEERLFPESRHRSARVKKKLLKRLGGEFRMKPCMWMMGNKVFAHPALKARLEHQLGARL